MATPQERLAELVAKGQKLAADGVRSADASKEMETVLTEARDLRAQIEQNRSFSELNDWAGKSAGMLPMSAPGQVENFTAAGTATVEQLGGGAIRLSDEYGEGSMAPATRAVIDQKEYKKAFHRYLRTGVGGDVSPAIRTLSEGSDPAGGFLVPTDFLEKVISKEPTPTRVSGRVTHLTTSRDSLTMPRVNYTTDDLYTSGIRVTWTSEIPAASTTARVTDPVFGKSQIPVYTAMLSIPLTNDLIEDSGFPLLDYVAGKFAETIELMRDNMVLNGTGQGQPSGILMNPGDSAGTQPAIVLSGAAGTIGTDGTALIKLAMSLPEQYDDNAAMVFNKTNTGLAVAQLKDSNGRFLWGAGLQDSGLEQGFKNRALLGYPVVLSGFAPNIGTAAYPIVFGDFSGYYMVERVGFSVQVLRELYAETNQILVLGRIRIGGQVVEPWKLKAFKSNNT